MYPLVDRFPRTMRLTYLDNLRVILVVGVIAVHTAIVYGVDGSFYLEAYEEMGSGGVAVITVFVAGGFLSGLGAFSSSPGG